MRIALTMRVDAVPSRGERRDALDQRWAAVFDALGWTPILVPNRPEALAGLLASTSPYGALLTGGNDIASVAPGPAAAPERDETERLLVEHCRRRGLPVLGVCRGMQMLAVLHGARLVRVEGHVAKPHAVEVTGDLAAHYPGGARVNSFHEFGVLADGLPESLACWARADDGTVESFAARGGKEVGVMWHPEREAPLRPEDLSLMRAVFEGGR